MKSFKTQKGVHLFLVRKREGCHLAIRGARQANQAFRSVIAQLCVFTFR